MNWIHLFERMALAVALAAGTAGVSAQGMSLQSAHELGLTDGNKRNDEVGTGNINQETAKEIPLYKDSPKQQGDYHGGVGEMFNIGMSRITESKAYKSGSCDREGFDPETAAKEVKGEAQWVRLTPAQKERAIKEQIVYFDQECESINFLTGEYQGRTRYEIPDDDQLQDWLPKPNDPNEEGTCTTQTVTTPNEYTRDSCHESSAIEKKYCWDTAVVNTWTEEVITNERTVTVIVNHNSPAWTLDIRPDEGVVHVSGDRIFLGTELVWSECGGGDAGTYPCQVTANKYGPATETISMHGAMTSMWQIYRSNERFHVRSQRIDWCTFRFDNFHISGGAGAPDVHMYWQHNFCVPRTHFEVHRVDNCSPFEGAMNQ